MKRIYLDNGSSTKILPEVLKEMRRVENFFGNPSAMHTEGRTAREEIEKARSSIARGLLVKPDEVIFAGSATEANTLAIVGYLAHLHSTGIPYDEMEVISTAGEHASIKANAGLLADLGVKFSFVPVTGSGRVDVEKLPQMLTEKTRLVSVSFYNGEIGVVQPIKKISSILRKYSEKIILHTDTSTQAPLYFNLGLDATGAHMMTLDGHKIGGPKGVGVLIKKNNVRLRPILAGVGQEKGIRPSTENLIAIAGFAKAFDIAQKQVEKSSEKVMQVRDYGIKVLTDSFENLIVLNGSTKYRSPNNINVSFPGYDTEYLAVLLDTRGIAVSTKSACHGADGTASSAVLALDEENMPRAKSSLRITLGKNTTRREMDALVKAIKESLDLTKRD